MNKIEDIIKVLTNPNDLEEPKLRFIREKLWRKGYISKSVAIEEYILSFYGEKLLKELLDNESKSN